MQNYTKDEINFHSFLNAMRKIHNVTLEQLCEGLCSVSMMQRIESGERLPEKQMRDRILSRMGVPLEGYEDYLSAEEYEQWHLRQKILGCIEKKKVREAGICLKEYRKYEDQNVVEAQFCKAVELMILQLKEAPYEIQLPVVECAVKFTMPNIDEGLSDKRLLSEQELNLLIEYAWIKGCSGEVASEFMLKRKQYEEFLFYMEHSRIDSFSRAKVYPKAAYYLCETILRKSNTIENVKLGLKICEQAVKLLRNSRKLYYFVELTEVFEKLLKNLELLLPESEKRDLEPLYQSLLEKKSWREMILELYAEHKVEPYMENFCHVYWETESYCIGDVIRTRRKMFGMTKEQLCEGICSVKTLTRIELKKAKTQMPIVRELFERLGLCAEYVRARVITSDYEVLQLAEKLAWYENNFKLDEWENSLKELEQKLCMDIPQNKQFIRSSYYLLELKTKKLSKMEFIEKMVEIIEYTIPLENAMKQGKKYLSREERTYMYNIGMRADTTKENPYLSIVREICEQDESTDGLIGHISKYEFLMTGVISYLGNIGAYDSSDELNTRLTNASLVYRRSGILAETLYNNLWNDQQRLLQNLSVSREYNPEKELKKCILLSKYNKMDKLIHFFEQKLLSCREMPN